MKVELNEIKKNPLRVYPYIGKHPQSKVVVLFTEKDSGFVLEEGDRSGYGMGEYSPDWNEGAFYIFEGEIVLSND